MEEYKYILIQDDSDLSNAKLKAFVERWGSIQTAYIYSIQKEDGVLTITWNMWMPSGAEHDWFKRQTRTLTNSASIRNVLATQFRLPPSLQRALEQVGTPRAREALPNISCENARALRWWGLIDAIVDLECIGPNNDTQPEIMVWFQEKLMKVCLTQIGEDTLR